MRKIDKKEREKIRVYLESFIAGLENPRSFGKALKGKCSEFWRYRVGNYRIVCRLEDSSISILVLRVAHRKDVYQKLTYAP
jgi:mRNA interferase RelE/StbE